MKKKTSLKRKPVFLLLAAIILLLASTVGSTQAALTYYSENYSAEVTVSNIGVTLLENEKEVSRRNYIGESKNDWDDTNPGKLLEYMHEDEFEFVLGKNYQEELTVKNSGAIDSYVRVVLRKSWQNDKGVKDTTLSPELIDLSINTKDANGNVIWILDEAASTPERTVLYYKNILKVGETTVKCTDTIRIDPAIGTKVIETVETTGTEQNPLNTITYEYQYDGYTFNIEAEVDAVQTHNAVDAIKSAWGVDVTVENGSINLK